MASLRKHTRLTELTLAMGLLTPRLADELSGADVALAEHGQGSGG